MKCHFCGRLVKFIRNKTTERDKLLMFVGDRGGHYEFHSCPQQQKFFRKILGKKKKKRRSRKKKK
ncbi:MAG: hypothetical protein Q7S19_00670 [bacterium]|nr:hypothetical protein [bacterium]